MKRDFISGRGMKKAPAVAVPVLANEKQEFPNKE